MFAPSSVYFIHVKILEYKSFNFFIRFIWRSLNLWEAILLFSFLRFFFFLIYDIVLVLPCISMNPSWVYTCFPSRTPLPGPSPYHPTGSSQCTSPEHPVSCIEPELVICFTYDMIHVSMLFSQIIPPSPSPTESKRLFYLSLPLLLSRIQDYCYHLFNSIYMH